MTDAKDKEKREFVRSTICTRARAVPLTARQYEKIRAMKATIPPLPTNLAHLANEQRWDRANAFLYYFAAHLNQIDEKLDRVLRLLDDKAVSKDFVDVVETEDISGSGASLKITGNVAEGQLLQIALELPGFPLGLFKVCAKVVRISPHPESDRHSLVGVKFLDITERERELLISCTFSQQREIIRQAKELQDEP